MDVVAQPMLLQLYTQHKRIGANRSEGGGSDKKHTCVSV